MFSRHISRQLAAYADGELATREAQRVARHAAQCDRCRTDLDEVRFGKSMLEHLPVAEPPDAVWDAIEAAFPRPQPRPRFSASRWRRPAFAAFAILCAAGAAYWMAAHRPGTRWEVVQIRGAVHGVARIGAGEWVETDASSSATVKVGEIGSVEVAPNTRLRVVTARRGEHRLALARGEIRAKIYAPPRLFFVETRSGTAVDLGCEYALHADEGGSGLLQVTRGWVSFQWKGVESLVPAGASCRTTPQAGPGVPYFDDAPEKLRQALENGSLDTVLAEARVRDTLTLWHLLWRVGFADRQRIYDRIAALTPVPAGVSREKALKLDPATLTLWKDELAWTW